MPTITSTQVKSFHRYIKGYYDLKSISEIENLYKSLIEITPEFKTYYKTYPIKQYPILYRGIHVNRNTSTATILDKALKNVVSSWTTDIDVAVNFARKPAVNEIPYLLIINDTNGIDVNEFNKLCEVIVNNVPEIDFETYDISKSDIYPGPINSLEKEVVLCGPLHNIYIFEIPDTYYKY